MELRQAFGEALVELGNTNERLVVLDADVSSSTRTRLFGEAYPDRFFNFGVAEQNMVAAAAGFATLGLTPVASTFAFLMMLRASEQVRSSIAYPSLHVVLAGGYSGLSDSKDGASHQSVCDVAVARSLPNMTVLVPSGAARVRQTLSAAVDMDGPVYLRLSRAAGRDTFSDDEPFEPGKIALVRSDGEDATIVACGLALAHALDAADILKKDGVAVTVVEAHTIKPFDAAGVREFAAKTGVVATVEEHSVIGGLGSAAAEALAGVPCAFDRLGLEDTFAESGDVDGLFDKYGLSPRRIAERVKALL